ncbi:MAG: hypothetical protein RMK64_09665 [Rhodovarius sp.]|nr:hypothetical protein [Rhodovarius sp.]MCX7933600.1 hypothetical protein [Rhodovarius sp.]MDW8315224.1 hypothetical protein [Rhodovarius sp.]
MLPSISILLFFPVIPVMVMGGVLAGMAVAAVPILWILLWLTPPAWWRDMPLAVLFPACMLLVPPLLIAAVMGAAVASPPRELAPIEKPSLEEVRERQALFRHLLPARSLDPVPQD